MPAKILLVEDDPGITELMKLVLQKEGHEVRFAHEGQAALDTAVEWQPDLVILDVMLPGMDGYEVCKRLREMPATTTTPILMLTALGSLDNKASGYLSGANDYLTKPIQTVDLIPRINALLDRARQTP